MKYILRFLSASMILIFYITVFAQDAREITYGDRVYDRLATPADEEFLTSEYFVFEGNTGDSVTITFYHEALISLAGREEVIGGMFLVNNATGEEIIGNNTFLTSGYSGDEYEIADYILPDDGFYTIVVYVTGYNTNSFIPGSDYYLILTTPDTNRINPGEYEDVLEEGMSRQYRYAGRSGEELTITTTADFDTVVYLLQDGYVVDSNDETDDLPNGNSRLIVTIPETGDYVIEVASYQNAEAGTYILSVESSLGERSESPAELEYAQSNADWTPILETFDAFEMVQVPPACFQMGLSEDTINAVLTEQSNVTLDDIDADTAAALRGLFLQHEVCIDYAFWIDKTEVSQEYFYSYEVEREEFDTYVDGSLPVENISWFEAYEFCELRGMRLPTEAEWELAAAGPDALLYPWGNEFQPELVISNRTQAQGTAPVGSIPENASWVGALDMVGNVAEWTSSIRWDYPYVETDGRENRTDRFEVRSVRGGSFEEISPYNVINQLRSFGGPTGRNSRFGFRCAQTISN